MVRFGLSFVLGVLAMLFTMEGTKAEYQEDVPNEFLLKGKIADTVHIPPPCGIFAFAVAVKMEVLEYSDTNYRQKHLTVIYTCPSDTAYFRIGNVHIVKVRDRNPASFSWIIMNQEVLSENRLKNNLFVSEMITK